MKNSAPRLPEKPDEQPRMSTTKFLAAIFAGLLILCGVAAIWHPDQELGDKVPLVWVSDNNPARTAQIAAFNAENPDLSLRLDFGNGGTQKIILQSSSGVGPDIFDFGSADIETFVESGVLWDVTDASVTMGFSALKDGWPEGAQTYTYNSRQYGFPCNTGAAILIYNKNVFDYFGVPYPQGLMTWKEFIDMAKKVNSQTSPKIGDDSRIFAVTGAIWQQFFTGQHGEFFDPDGQLTIAESPELYRAFEMHREFLFTHQFMPSTIEAKAMSGQGGWGSGNLNQFAAGRFAMAITGHWALIAFGQAYQQQLDELTRNGLKEEDIKDPLKKPLRLGAVLIPKFSKLPPSYQVQSRVAGINAKSPRREEPLKFLQYLAGPTYSELLNAGEDWLPGNPEYSELGVDPGPPALSRQELQDRTVEAMSYGYSPRQSPFLLTSDVFRVIGNQISRLESTPDISTQALLDAAQSDLQTLMRRTLERNPNLESLFIERFGKPAYQNL